MASDQVQGCPWCGGRLIPVLAGDLKGFRCPAADCFRVLPLPGFKLPDPLRLSPGCPVYDHVGGWCSKQRGRVIDWVCCVVLKDNAGNERRCGGKRTEGELMGFLNGRESERAYVSKDWVLQSVGKHMVATGEAATIHDIRRYAPALSDGQINGALGRSVQSQHLINLGKKLLPVQGSAFSYALRWRGLQYLLQKGLASQEDLETLVTRGAEK